ncbi:MAG TPA: hypothetical protein VK436_00515 [Methanocella sp.]|nr:hypothetical protein [Methanocella sp.]
MTDMNAIRTDLEHFNEALMQEEYESRAGLKDDADTAGIYDRYAGIFDDSELLYQVRSGRAAARGTEQLRMRYLYAFLLSAYISRRNTDLSDRISSLEAKAEIEVDGKTMPFRYASVAQANEPDHGRREAIDAAREAVYDQLNPPLKERLARSYKIANDFGYDNYVSMCMDMSGIDLHGLKFQMQNILHRTDRVYTKYFKNICKDLLGLNLSEVRACDIGYLFRVRMFDQHFSGDRMLKVMNQTLSGMGLQVTEGSSIHMDTDAREKKSPRAFCCPIKVPDNIILCIMPKGGMEDYRSLLHEMGHAQHFGNVAHDMAMEFKYMGDNSVTEAYAMLFEHLTGNKHWLEQQFEMTEEDLTSTTRFMAFQTLYMLRRYAAKFLYEIELHSGAESPEQLYVQLLSDALKFQHPEKRYLYDLDLEFYSACYLRAWMLEVQIRNVLTDKFGPNWWDEATAGVCLRNLWSTGQKYDGVNIARTIGYYGIDEQPLVRELEKTLRF